MISPPGTSAPLEAIVLTLAGLTIAGLTVMQLLAVRGAKAGSPASVAVRVPVLQMLVGVWMTLAGLLQAGDMNVPFRRAAVLRYQPAGTVPKSKKTAET